MASIIVITPQMRVLVAIEPGTPSSCWSMMGRAFGLTTSRCRKVVFSSSLRPRMGWPEHCWHMSCAHEELIDQAAQSRVVYNDDTTMKVLQLTKAQRAAALADDVKGERTGIFTSGIVASDD